MDDDALAATGDGPERLSVAPFEVVGRFADASNATLLARFTDVDSPDLAALAERLGRPPILEDLDPTDLAVFKPARGEAPLWDFPAGTLHRREVAAHLVSEALGWELVPVTVLREHPDLGAGSLQRFVPHDPAEHYFSLLESGDFAVLALLRMMVIFDVLVENADRKAGHVLVEEASSPGGSPRRAGTAGRLRLIDHGVTFHTASKLRTVAWDFAGEAVPGALLAAVAGLGEALTGGLGRRLAALLCDEEVAALGERVDRLRRDPVLPHPQGARPYPWPLL